MSSVDFLIPAFNASNVIKECIDSICKDNDSNCFSVIVYNDGSTDDTRQVLSEISQKYKKVTVHNAEVNKGIIHARKELIRLANSEYIFFVDADDYLFSIDPIFEYVKENKETFVQFSRKKINHQGVVSTHDKQLATISLAQKKILPCFGRWGKNNNLTYSIHSKLIKTNIVKKIQVPDDCPNIFEDILLNLYILPDIANAVLECRCVYMYRVSPDSATANPMKIIMASEKLVDQLSVYFDDRHYRNMLNVLLRNIFEYYIPNKIKNSVLDCYTAESCYAAFFAVLAKNKDLFENSLFNRIISRVFSHMCLIFNISNTASIAQQAGINIDDALYHTIRIIKSPPKKKPISVKTILKQRIIGDLKFIRKIIFRKTLAIKYAIYSTISRRASPYIAVIDYPGRCEAESFFANHLALPCKCFNSWDVTQKTQATVANAQLVITSVPYSPLAKLPLRGKVFNCWHGSGAFKRFGRFDKTSKNAYGHTDYIICSSEGIKSIYADSMKLPIDNVFAIGTPRTDAYFDNNHKKILQNNFFEQFPHLINKKIYVYMPTYRELNKKRFFATSFSMDHLNANLLEDEIFIIKNHPSITARIVKNNAPAAYTNVRSIGRVMALDDIDTETLTIVASVFITDYSSAFFEAMLIDKPLVFYAEDFARYNRDFYFDYEELPGEKITEASLEKLLTATRRALLAQKAPAYNEFKQKHLGACDGGAIARSVAIINQLISKGNSAL